MLYSFTGRIYSKILFSLEIAKISVIRLTRINFDVGGVIISLCGSFLGGLAGLLLSGGPASHPAIFPVASVLSIYLIMQVLMYLAKRSLPNFDFGPLAVFLMRETLRSKVEDAETERLLATLKEDALRVAGIMGVTETVEVFALDDEQIAAVVNCAGGLVAIGASRAMMTQDEDVRRAIVAHELGHLEDFKKVKPEEPLNKMMLGGGMWAYLGMLLGALLSSQVENYNLKILTFFVLWALSASIAWTVLEVLWDEADMRESRENEYGADIRAARAVGKESVIKAIEIGIDKDEAWATHLLNPHPSPEARIRRIRDELWTSNIYRK